MSPSWSWNKSRSNTQEKLILANHIQDNTAGQLVYDLHPIYRFPFITVFEAWIEQAPTIEVNQQLITQKRTF